MKLTKRQTELAISDILVKDNGLNQVLEMVLNSMMYLERSEFISSTSENKCNGFRLGKVFGHGSQLELRIPRDRRSEFKPLIMALFRDQENYLKEVSFDLYSKGLTTRDVSDVMETIYGKYYSKSTISNFSKSFYQEMSIWRNRELETHYLAIYIDGLFVKVKRDNKYKNECYYVVMGLKEDCTREIISIESLPTESSTGWELVLDGLKHRGVESVGLVVSDNLKGLDKAVNKCFKNTDHQLCTVHLQRNLQAMVRTEDKKALASDIREVLSPDEPSNSYQKAMGKVISLKLKWSKYPRLINHLSQINWTNYLTFLKFNQRVRRMIYTTNWIERFNKSARRTLKIRGALPSEESVLALITSVAIDKGEKTYKYPIYNFKFETNLMK